MKIKVKHERISKYYFPHLSDEEILSAITYCKRILDRKDLVYIEEFNDICFFFYEGNIENTEDSIKEILDLYTVEYMKRRSN
jgi:hypothetical protein